MLKDGGGINLEVGSQENPPDDLNQDLGIGQVNPEIPEQGAAGIVVTDDVAKKLLQLPFNVMATRRGKHWLLSEPESDLLTQPMARVLKKYSLQLSEKYPDGFLILLGLTVSISARAAIDAALRQEAAEQEKRKDESEHN